MLLRISAPTSSSIEPILKAGNTFAGLCNAKPNTIAEKLSQCAQDINVIKLSKLMLSGANMGNGFCLSSASDNPEAACAWYNYIFQSQEFNDLINWGIEGTDWVENEDGLADFPEGGDATTVSYHNDYRLDLPEPDGRPSVGWQRPRCLGSVCRV